MVSVKMNDSLKEVTLVLLAKETDSQVLAKALVIDEFLKTGKIPSNQTLFCSLADFTVSKQD